MSPSACRLTNAAKAASISVSDALCARCFLSAPDRGFGCRTVRIHKQRNCPGLRKQIAQQFESLGGELGEEDAQARGVAARSGEALHQSSLDRVVADLEDDRDRRGCAFRCAGGRRPEGGDQINLARDEIGGHGRQPVILTRGPAVFELDVLSIDKAGFP